MSVICGIDPVTEKIGFLLFDEHKVCVTFSSEMMNEVILEILRGDYSFPGIPDACTWSELYIEDIESMGLTVGKSTFVTVKWIGKFEEAYAGRTKRKAVEVSRGDEKITLCGARTYLDKTTGKRRGVKDAEIRRAVIDRFPPTGGGKNPQVGTKKEPGPLYGVKGHCWSALAVLITGMENANKKGSE